MSYHSSRGKYYDTLNTQSQEYIYICILVLLVCIQNKWLKSTFAIDKKWSPILKYNKYHLSNHFLQLLAEWWTPKCPLKRL